MGNTLLVDNWMLQDLSDCLANGLSTEDASALVIDRLTDSHSAQDVPMAGVQIEALISFLVDIVLRDSIILDSGFANAWSENESTFAPVLQNGLMRPIDLFAYEDRLKDPRKVALGQLCVTSSLLKAQQENEKSWESVGVAANQYMSQIVWGTAGMLSRSHVFEATYSGHPLRKRLLEQTMLSTEPFDVVGETLEWMNDERLRLFDIRAKQGLQRTAMLILPPIAIEVIHEANDISQLLPIAYQLRDKYAKVREWMKSIQIAMDSDDPKGVIKYKKTLDAVSRDLDRAIKNTDSGNTSLKVGIGWPSVSFSVGTFDNIAKCFGMRAMLSNQVFSPKGEKSMKKLLRMFDEEKSSIGLSVQEYLRFNGSKHKK